VDYEANLSPEGMIQSLGEILQGFLENFSSERDGVDLLESGSRNRSDRQNRSRRLNMKHGSRRGGKGP
jgi:hypothetical protein